MRIIAAPSPRIAAGLLLAVLLSVVGCHVLRWRNPASPEALLERADEMSWLNSWIQAAPFYHQAEVQFEKSHQLSKALYARVSEMPANSEGATSVPAQIALLRDDLSLPEAHDPETRLRILTILGMLETNYDAGIARETWTQVESVALSQHHFLLASRAVGELGIAAFLLGDMATAKKDVVKAWMVAKTVDPGAHIRYASMYGTGLVELHKYNEALGPLNEAIKVAESTRGAAYPTIAITAKIGALSGLGKSQEALALANEEMQWVNRYQLAEHACDIFQTRAGVYEKMNDWSRAISDYEDAARYARQLSYWRGLTQVDGLLAKAYLHRGDLHSALTAIDEAIAANQRIPDELYFVPRNLAIKAEITARLGDTSGANRLYEKSEDMLDALLSKVPTPTVERQLLSDLSQVYSKHFISLSDEGKTNDAFRVIERARGRVEAQSLAHHEVITPHQLNPVEQHLTRLNVELLNSDDASTRAHTLDSIYEIEQQLNLGDGAGGVTPSPVDIRDLERDLGPSEVFIEYVLDSPQSYALAVTERSIHRYTLPSKDELEKEATQYRTEILQRKADLDVAQRLFDGLLARIPEFREKQRVIIVPDGRLHLLPFEALADHGQYLVASHLITVAPSGTVLHILRDRTSHKYDEELPYLGVAAWTMKSPTQATMLASILRSVSGPERKELVALPESQHEVETISSDLPSPNTTLLGTGATETNFKRLPLHRYNVIHLALHGYADPEFPDRSALIFAPQQETTDDSLLQVREIRKLHLNANLVTLSACNTGVGPIGEEGVANIVNAFIEAGSQSVVSTLWELEDHATTHLMTVFYDHLGHHEGKAESLRQAQLEMLNSGDLPYYWAGFVLDGEPSGNLFESPANTKSFRSRQ
jgi:CHAT domain-containing protein